MIFSKYHGCSNDFLIFVDAQVGQDQAARLCDRHTGPGADGIALITLPPGLAPPRMEIINADGSIPEMCGNALRCVVKHLVDNVLVAHTGNIAIATGAGILHSTYTLGTDGLVDEICVDMGPPRTPVEARTIVTPQGRKLEGHTVSMGNPHFVTLSERPQHDAKEFGRVVATHQDFAEGTNASFIRVIDRRRVEAVVYERGAGLTLACGTGACAIATVGRHLGLLGDDDVRVQLPGGALSIALSHTGHLMMRGPATWVYDGELERHGTNTLR